jgi:Restriction endonuclease fold toxin 9
MSTSKHFVVGRRDWRFATWPLMLGLVVLLAALWVGSSTTTASAATFTSDVPVLARDGVHSTEVARTPSPQLSDSLEGSASPTIDARRTSTTKLAGSVATEAAERVAVNGETTATRLGREMHASWDYGPGFTKEFSLRGGGRVDAINFETRQIIELKPNNPRAIRLGNSQIEGYLAKLNEQFPGEPWTGSVVTCTP